MFSSLKPWALALSFALLCLSSCQKDPCGNNKGEFLENQKQFVENFKKTDKASLSENQLKEQDAQMQHFLDACYAKYEGELSIEEKKNVLIAQGQYLYARHGAKLLTMALSKKDALVKKLSEELAKVEDMKIKDILQLIEK